MKQYLGNCMSDETISAREIWNEDRQNAFKCQTNCFAGPPNRRHRAACTQVLCRVVLFKHEQRASTLFSLTDSHKERETTCSTAHLWKLVANATQSVKFANGFQTPITTAVVVQLYISYSNFMVDSRSLSIVSKNKIISRTFFSKHRLISYINGNNWLIYRLRRSVAHPSLPPSPLPNHMAMLVLLTNKAS